MTSQAAKGKHTRLSDADLVTLARDGHTPEQTLKAEAGLAWQYREGIFGGLTVRERMALDSEAVA